MSISEPAASKSPSPDNQAIGVSELEWQKLELERRRLELDSSFPRKWGSVLFGTLGTIAVAIITVGANLLVQTWQSEETERAREEQASRVQIERAREDARVAIENARDALSMYFAHLDAMSPERRRGLHHMKLIAEVSNHDGVRDIFLELYDEAVRISRDRNPDKDIADIVAELPSPSMSTPRASSTDGMEELPPYTVYIQYPRIDSRPELRTAAEKVADALRNMGMRVPGLEALPVNRVPINNELRFYSEMQRRDMDSLVDRLKGATGVQFSPSVLQLGRSLPEGIFEVWIGRGRR